MVTLDKISRCSHDLPFECLINGSPTQLRIQRKSNTKRTNWNVRNKRNPNRNHVLCMVTLAKISHVIIPFKALSLWIPKTAPYPMKTKTQNEKQKYKMQITKPRYKIGIATLARYHSSDGQPFQRPQLPPPEALVIWIFLHISCRSG